VLPRRARRTAGLNHHHIHRETKGRRSSSPSRRASSLACAPAFYGPMARLHCSAAIIALIGALDRHAFIQNEYFRPLRCGCPSTNPECWPQRIVANHFGCTAMRWRLRLGVSAAARTRCTSAARGRRLAAPHKTASQDDAATGANVLRSRAHFRNNHFENVSDSRAALVWQCRSTNK